MFVYHTHTYTMLIYTHTHTHTKKNRKTRYQRRKRKEGKWAACTSQSIWLQRSKFKELKAIFQSTAK